MQFFLDREIPFCPRSAVISVLESITGTHVSGDFHKMVVREPGKFFLRGSLIWRACWIS